MIGSIAQSFLSWVDRRGWVTWERTAPDAEILIVTNAWPDRELPARAMFMRYTVDGLAAAGVETDVLYIRDRGHALFGCLAMGLMALARPGRYQLVHSDAGETALVARFFWSAPVLASYWGSDLLGTSRCLPQEGPFGARLDGIEHSAVCKPDPEALAAEIVRCLRAGDRSNGREHSEHLSLEHATERTLACYRSLGVTVPGS